MPILIPAASTDKFGEGHQRNGKVVEAQKHLFRTGSFISGDSIVIGNGTGILERLQKQGRREDEHF